MSGKESKAADLRLGDQAERGTGICEKNPSFLSRKMTAFSKIVVKLDWVCVLTAI